LLGAMQVAGMTVAFPIAYGVALVIGAILSYVLNPMTNMILIFSGAILTLIAVVTMAFAHVFNLDALSEARTSVRADPRAPRSPRPPSAARGIALSLVSGILLSVYLPLSDAARTGETALSPYSAALLFGGGMLFSTLLYSPFFLTFPVHGKPVQLWDYVKATKQQHFLGLLGGILWMAGTVAAYAAAGGSAQPSFVVIYALWQGVPLVAALWGLLAWREFQGATVRVKMLLTSTLVLYMAGVAVVAVAPLYPKQ
jgi:glucose uptake protein